STRRCFSLRADADTGGDAIHFRLQVRDRLRISRRLAVNDGDLRAQAINGSCDILIDRDFKAFDTLSERQVSRRQNVDLLRVFGPCGFERRRYLTPDLLTVVGVAEVLVGKQRLDIFESPLDLASAAAYPVKVAGDVIVE